MELLQWSINFLIKKTCGSVIKNEIMSDQRPSELPTRQLAKELHKTIIRKYNKINVQSSFYRQYLRC